MFLLSIEATLVSAVFTVNLLIVASYRRHERKSSLRQYNSDCYNSAETEKDCMMATLTLYEVREQD